jgi:TolB-like protein
MKKNRLLVHGAPLLCGALFALAGCTQTIGAQPSDAESRSTPVASGSLTLAEPSRAAGFSTAIAQLAEQLERNTRHKTLLPAVLASTFVNLDDLDDTSPLGRLITENLVHELQIRRWNVYDIRLSKAVAVNPTGEFVLTRDPKLLEYQYLVAGVLAGTYSIAGNEVFVNARIIDINTGVVVSSGQISLPIDEFVARLLVDGDQLKPMRIIRGK